MTAPFTAIRQCSKYLQSGQIIFLLSARNRTQGNMLSESDTFFERCGFNLVAVIKKAQAPEDMVARHSLKSP
jgi:hypothetical protein